MNEAHTNLFLFDMEWVNYAPATTALLKQYTMPRERPSKNPEASVGQTVEQFESDIKSLKPTSEWLYQCLAVEESGKRRQSILKSINQELDAIENPTPDKVAQMAEAVMPICMCYTTASDNDFSVIHSVVGEANVAKAFCRLSADARPCGWAIDFADMPVIAASIARLKSQGTLPDCTLPFCLDLKKGNSYIDLMKLRFGYNAPCKQRDVAAAIGYVPSYEDPLKDGSQVQAAYDEDTIESLNSIVDHNRLDVEALAVIYKHYRGLIW